jgi:hypothetical protein
MNQSNVISLRVSQPATAGEIMYLRPDGRCSSMTGKQLIPTANVTVADNTITVAEHNFEANLNLKYFHGGGAPITGLANDTSYYVVSNTPQSFYLSAAVPKAITGASNADPLAITAVAHGFATNDLVAISGVEGNIAANGLHKITKVNADSFTLADTLGNDIDGSITATNLAYVATTGVASKIIGLTGTGTGAQYLQHQGLANKSIGVLIHDVNDEESGNPAAIQLFNHGILHAEAKGPIVSGDIVGVSDKKNHVLTGANGKAIGWSLESLASGTGTVRVITN